ncbi:MAG: helix-turn-helix domain-containing protein, partial [Desulforhopalus sp.]
THVNLPEAVRENRFRQDLYYRLNIVEIHIPSLRERGAGDIEMLANHFMKSYGAKSSLSDNALEALYSYTWPGNVRELENTIQRALHNCQGLSVEAKHLKLPKSSEKNSPSSYGTLREMEKEMIEKTMIATGTNIAKTARELGISRATLYRKLKEYGFQQ